MAADRGRACSTHAQGVTGPWMRAFRAHSQAVQVARSFAAAKVQVCWVHAPQAHIPHCQSSNCQQPSPAQDRGSGFTTPTRSSVTPLRRPRFTPASRTASRGKLAAGWGRTQAPSGRLLPKSPPPSPETLDSGAEGAGHQHGGGPGAAGATAAARAAWWAVARAWLGAASGTCADLLRSGDALLRAGLRRNLHALVSLLLIAGLLVGSTCLGAFLTVQVVQEGRAAVLSVRDVFPTAWAGVAIAPPLPATAAAAAAVSAAAGAGASSAGVCEVQQAAEALGLPPAGGGPLCPVPGPALPPPPPPPPAAAAAAAEGAVAAAGGPGAPRAAPVAAPTPGMAAPGSAGPARGAAMSQPARALKGWLAPYQSEAQGLIQRSLPGLATWVEGQFDDFMARHNLTAAAGDLRLLYETVQVGCLPASSWGAGRCWWLLLPSLVLAGCGCVLPQGCLQPFAQPVCGVTHAHACASMNELRVRACCCTAGPAQVLPQGARPAAGGGGQGRPGAELRAAAGEGGVLAGGWVGVEEWLGGRMGGCQ